MKKTASLLLAGMFALVCTPAVAATKLIVAFEDKQQFPNYMGNSTKVDPDKPGLHVELVAMTAAELGIDLEFVRQPWKRALDSLKKGEVDAVFSGSFSPDRMEIGLYPMKGDAPDEDLRIGTTSYSLYRVKGSAVGWDGKAFSGLSGRINAPAGYSIVADLKKLNVEVEESASTTQDMTMLKAGRAQAVAAQGVTADQILRKPEFSSIEKVSPPIVTKSYYLIFSHQFARKDPELVERFWKTLSKNRSEKTDEIAAKYAE